MIVASWIMSTVISIPPLFDLQEPADGSTEAFQMNNQTRNDVDRRHWPPDTAVSSEALRPFETYDFSAFDDASDQYSVMNWDDADSVYADVEFNETISSACSCCLYRRVTKLLSHRKRRGLDIFRL